MFAFIKKSDIKATDSKHLNIIIYRKNSKLNTTLSRQYFQDKHSYYYVRGLDCYIYRNQRRIMTPPFSSEQKDDDDDSRLQRIIRSFCTSSYKIKCIMGCELLLFKKPEELAITYISNTSGNHIFNNLNSLKCHFTLYKKFDLLILMYIHGKNVGIFDNNSLGDFDFIQHFFVEDEEHDGGCQCVRKEYLFLKGGLRACLR